MDSSEVDRRIVRGRVGGRDDVEPSASRMGRPISDCLFSGGAMFLEVRTGVSVNMSRPALGALSLEVIVFFASSPTLFVEDGPEKNDGREIDGIDMDGMDMDGIDGIDGKASRILFSASAPPDEERRWPLF